MLYGVKVFKCAKYVYNLTLQDARVELLTELEYFMGAFIGPG